MKVLEIKGFMHFPLNYEGEHEVIRWRMGGVGGERVGIGQSLRTGWKLQREVASLGVDIIVCQCFGLGYGKEGGELAPLRHWTKSRYEGVLIHLVKGIQRACGAPLAVVDIADDPTIHPINEPLLDVATCYFKRELPIDPFHAFESLRRKKSRPSTVTDRSRANWERWLAKLKPISLGCAAREPGSDFEGSDNNKRWDIFYSGDAQYKPRRGGIVEAVRELEKQGWRVRVPDAPLGIDEYLKELSQSRIAISPPGLGWDCHRHYESAHVGTVPVTPFPTIQRHAPFINGEHCLFYDPEKPLVGQLRAMLEAPGKLEKIARRAKAHANRHHTFEKIFDYLVTRTKGSDKEAR